MSKQSRVSSGSDRASWFACRGEVMPEEKVIIDQFVGTSPGEWKCDDLQVWVSELLRYSYTHVSNISPKLEVDLVFTKLGNGISEEKFLSWLVTFQERLEFSVSNQAMVCGIRFDINKSGGYTGMVFVKLRSVGLRTLVEACFDGTASPFPPGNRIRVRQPRRAMKFEARGQHIKGRARFETDVYRTH